MKPIIICIVGPSGSGKTYMSHFLQEKKNIPAIVSLTDRPMREGEINGIDHWFTDKHLMRYYLQQNAFIAHTLYGGYNYGALHEDINKHQICSYVIDEHGLEEITKKFSDKYQIVSVYIKMSEKNRLKHGISQDRIKRDNSRKRLPNDYYDYIIYNNGTIRDFETKILEGLNGYK